MLDRRATAAGHFEINIDSHRSSAYVKSVEGGFGRASPMEEPTGHELHRLKHTSVLDIDPISLEIGMGEANNILLWIRSSWKRGWSRRNGEIIHADFNLKSTYTQEFKEALITETTFPALDGASKEPAYLKVKLQPEDIAFSKTPGTTVGSPQGTKQKMWISSAFRLTLDGYDVSQTSKIESFAIKQGVKKHYVGGRRLPSIEPTKLEFPNLVCTIALSAADDLIAWYQDEVISGADERKLTTGSIEFLRPDRTASIFRIDLKDVGLHHLEVIKSDANADAIKRVKFELVVGAMDLTGDGALGFE